MNRHFDVDSGESHAKLMCQAATLKPAYLHVMRARAHADSIDAFATAPEQFGSRLILNGGFDDDSAEAALAAGTGAANYTDYTEFTALT